MTNLVLAAMLMVPTNTPVRTNSFIRSTNASPYFTLPTVPVQPFKYASYQPTVNWHLLYSTNMKTWVEETNFVFDALFTNVTYKSNRLTGVLIPVSTNIYTNIITVKARALNEFFRVMVNTN